VFTIFTGSIGIINAFKAKYKSRIVRQWLNEPDNAQFLKKITLKDAVTTAAECWNDIEPISILNCWRKTGILGSEKSMTMTQESDYRPLGKTWR